MSSEECKPARVPTPADRQRIADEGIKLLRAYARADAEDDLTRYTTTINDLVAWMTAAGREIHQSRSWLARALIGSGMRTMDAAKALRVSRARLHVLRQGTVGWAYQPVSKDPTSSP